jgi:hypothetical protein
VSFYFLAIQEGNGGGIKGWREGGRERYCRGRSRGRDRVGEGRGRDRGRDEYGKA